MAGQPIFRGQGASIQRDKNRFVLPAKFRPVLKDKNHGGESKVSFNKSPQWTCLIGYGDDYSDQFAEMIEQEKREAREDGVPYDVMLRKTQLYNDVTVPFDNGGRFVMPPSLLRAAKIDDQAFFLSAGEIFLVWAPEQLYAMGDEWDMAKENCRDEMAAELAKGNRK
ncbi:division/cell wall cluster transcriptional repressor MraZ [Novosphingobium aquimarinum]|uniref:division/cell wall cluster transcriptional repressor MraZ n=1 Tax=Novosphingobium aquimarinum TaxID=2682494 RepID=UPI0012EB9F48|nr:division/cell wall cluster transcriptional repressor MraZ [Novosphingobium aquimarinum]